MAFTLPTINRSKCLVIVWTAFLYLFLSGSIAFLCHRLFLPDTPAMDAVKSVFAACVLVVTLWGLVAWTTFRVFVYLLIPKLFNVNGRTVLIAYISFLTISGPLWNTQRNIGVMSTTLACSFKEIETVARDLWDLMMEPVVYIKNLIDTMEERAKKIFAQLADDLRHIETLAEDMRGWWWWSTIQFSSVFTHVFQFSCSPILSVGHQVSQETLDTLFGQVRNTNGLLQSNGEGDD